MPTWNFILQCQDMLQRGRRIRTVSPPRKNQKPKNLFFPSRVVLSGASGHVFGVNCSSTCIMPLPLYLYHPLIRILEYGIHDRPSVIVVAMEPNAMTSPIIKTGMSP